MSSPALHSQQSQTQHASITPSADSPSSIQALNTPLPAFLLLHNNPGGTDRAGISSDGDDSAFRLGDGDLGAPQDGLKRQAHGELDAAGQEGEEVVAGGVEEGVEVEFGLEEVGCAEVDEGGDYGVERGRQDQARRDEVAGQCAQVCEEPARFGR
jgi:hypothetical protein